jgi:C-terminal processing protease CtpA/Prc
VGREHAAAVIFGLASEREEVMADLLEVERLAAVGRLWGKAKLFHPNIATRAIDWDGALVEAVAKTREARSREDFRAAVDGLLAALGDPQTVSWKRPEAVSAPTTQGTPVDVRDGRVFKVIDNVVVLICHRIARSVSRDGAEALKKVAPTLEGELAAARGVVLDCRVSSAAKDERASGYELDTYLRTTFAEKFRGSITLGTYRFREHSGHVSDVFVRGGSYWSAFSMRTPDLLEGRASCDVRPKATVVIDDETDDFRDLWSGLQCAGLARIVIARHPRDAPMNRPGDQYIDFDMPEGFQVRLRTTEYINPDGRIGWRPDAEVSADEPLESDAALDAALALIADPSRVTPYPSSVASLALQGHREKRYAEMTFPDANYRLLGLFRVWNAMEHFFPYKYLMDSEWSPALEQFIPRFDACSSALDYETTVAELAMRLADSHVFVQLAPALDAERGAFAPPLTVAAVEGSTCIIGLRSEAARQSGLTIGDVVLAVDDEDAEARRARLGRLIASSTPQALRRVVSWRFLGGPENSVARLRIRDADGELRTVEIARDTRWQTVASPPERNLPVSGVLPSGHGYIDLERLEAGDVDEAMAAVAGVGAVIFDMRGYPRGVGLEIAARLAQGGRPIVGAQFRVPYWPCASGAPSACFFAQPVAATDKPRYAGKVVMLINEYAMSASEHFCLHFEAAADVTFIGSPTSGANGMITSVALPGGMFVTFTGADVRHGDGRQLQRVGIQPHIHVEPTLGGLRAGRDEVLEAAIAHLDARRP